jgi:anthranilate phosphoribosyltransferase
VSELRDGEVKTYQIDPESFGFASAQFSDLVGGTAQENAVITKAILDGEDQGARRDTVVLNAAAALLASGKAADLPDGIQLAQESIDSGAALRVLTDLVEFTNQ